MSQTILEARGVIVESAEGGLAVQYITPGIGSSGYYSPDVLSEAASANLFPKGMQLYVDHPSATDRASRPERSVRDIGGISTSDGVWNEEAQAVEASIKILEGHSWLKDPDLRSAIGLSIRATGNVKEGKVAGRTMPIVEKLTEVYSVDFVTHAGRGGRILEARVEDAILEASANDRREALSNAVREQYGSGNGYAWVLDYDDDTSTVYFSIEGASDSETYSQSYDATDSGVSLTGSRVAVRRVTNYVPVRAGTGNTTEGETVADTPELTEAQTALAEARRENETLKAENASLKEAAKTREIEDAAREIVTAHLAESKTHPDIAARVVAIVATAPKRTANGDLDEAALKASADVHKAGEIAYLARFQTSPAMTGGGFTTSTTVAESGVTREQADAERARAFGRN